MTLCRYGPEGDSEYFFYQKYYVNGFRYKFPFWRMHHVRTRQPFDDNSRPTTLFQSHTTHVGQYVFILKNGMKINVAIDAHDHRVIRSPEILKWSDIYFKSNRWLKLEYNKKVHPIVNGNGLLSADRIRYLKSLRHKERKYDFCFVAHVWAGGDSNVEHNLRLFEGLAKVGRPSKMRAVFIGFEDTNPELSAYAQRLHRAGVEFGTKQLGYEELMEACAQAKCVVIRSGVSCCIPWRMVEMLCMGACLLLDRTPFPSWPVPLVEMENFVSLNLEITEDCGPAPLRQYDGIARKLIALTDDPGLQERIRASNRIYFDHHAHPSKVADYVIGKLKLTGNL